uniref:Dynein regulatory complex subunit 3 n=1 Tax=Knipowitschia caucasica TaxID=637954 RepID=A0AAV2KK02_KNICA
MFGRGRKPWTADDIIQNVVAQRGKDSRRNVDQEVEFGEVKELDLGSRCFSRIERLWQFSSLTTLLLNNNGIQKIEGLSRLYNLRTLNLSFNAIMKIEGLENLKKLEELNLCNNNIAVLENMDSLEKLVLLNMSNNVLKELSQVLYLKILKHLYTLNFSGNPLSEEGNYELFIVAFFPNLTYLDYKYVNKEFKERASVEFHIKLQKLYDENVAKETKTEELKSQQEEQQLHLDAFVESLNGSFLFERMFKDDPLSDRLKSEKMTGLCVQLFETGLVEHERRRAEVDSFYRCHSDTIAHIIQKETEVLGEFEQYFKEMKKELATLQTVQGKDELNKLQKDLLTLEFKLISQIERMIKKLDAVLSEMLSNFCETAQEIYPFAKYYVSI